MKGIHLRLQNGPLQYYVLVVINCWKSKILNININTFLEDSAFNLRAIELIVKAKADPNLCYWGLYKSAQSRNFEIANPSKT